MRAIDLYINGATGELVTFEGHRRSDRPEWHRGDKFLLRLTYLTVIAPGQEGGTSAYALPETSTWRLGGKAEAGTGNFLFDSDSDQFNLGDWVEADPAEGKLSVRVDLERANLNAAIIGKQKLECKVDIEEMDDEGRRYTIQFVVDVINDVIRGTEGVEPDPPPTYITLAQAYAAFLAVVTPTVVVETATDELSYDVAIEAEPAQVILSVRRPEGGTSHLAANWSIEDAGATLRVYLSALPPAGTKIYATIIESAP